MSPSFSVKGGRRYHYYVSSISKDIDRGLVGAIAAPIARVAAGRIEAAVREALHALLTDERQLVDLLDDGDTATTRLRLATAAELARLLGPYATDGRRSLFRRLDVSLTVYGDRVDASIARAALLAALDHDATVETEDDRRVALTVNTNITHRKRGARLIIAGNAAVAKEPDPSLVALITKAHQARTALFSQAAPRGDRHIERLARLAYLAPDITTAILDGTQPAALTSHKLLKLPALSLGWPEQRKLLGFA
jgi:site-specific DNA recombinase